MKPILRLSEPTRALLRCPVCRSLLDQQDMAFTCQNPRCATTFPVVEGIPVLINEANSVFSFEDFLTYKPTTMAHVSAVHRIAAATLPQINLNLKARQNYRALGRLLTLSQPTTLLRVLIVGGSEVGAGMRELLASAPLDLVESDVSLGPRTALVCDAHDIPFADESFDAVILQAVLEHVIDPERCVQETHRVLKSGGLIYAETAFMQQVHLREYDFMRFTHLGHRRLFRHFDEIASGAVCGPGMALAWAYQYFLLSFFTNRALRALMHVIARLSAFWIKYFDYYLIDKPGALDAASGCYFLGRKGGTLLTDRALIKLYRGAF